MSIAPIGGAGPSPAAAQAISINQPDPQLRAARQATAAPGPAEVGRAAGEQGETDPKEVSQRVDELNAAMKQHASSILFSIDEDSGRTIVKVVDTDTDTVLRQYPSEELLAISKQIDKFQGMFIKTQA